VSSPLRVSIQGVGNRIGSEMRRWRSDAGGRTQTGSKPTGGSRQRGRTNLIRERDEPRRSSGGWRTPAHLDGWPRRIDDALHRTRTLMRQRQSRRLSRVRLLLVLPCHWAIGRARPNDRASLFTGKQQLTNCAYSGLPGSAHDVADIHCKSPDLGVSQRRQPDGRLRLNPPN
jgi:hypothetical protein